MKELTETERKVNEKLEIRRKQFHALLTTIHHLQETLAGSMLFTVCSVNITEYAHCRAPQLNLLVKYFIL